jgi:hypothetical protein
MTPITAAEIKPGMLIRLGRTTTVWLGLVDAIVRVVAIDGDHLLVTTLSMQLSSNKELRISEWEFSIPDPDYLKMLLPEESWPEVLA